MPKEQEHKFLVDRLLLPSRYVVSRHIVQGYLSTKPAVRIRIVDNSSAYLTVKGSGTFIRDEFEYLIPFKDAQEMLLICDKLVIEKTRHCLDGWEIDEFHGRHAGLILAEYEINPGKELPYVLPPWVGKEVTNDARYSNASLAVDGLSKVSA